VECRDGGLGLELAQPVAGEGRLQDLDALGDRLSVPSAAVLLGERHQAAVGRGPGGAPGVVEQHEGEQPRHLGVSIVGRGPRIVVGRLGAASKSDRRPCGTQLIAAV
jgi:hypothetical protein